MTSPRSLAGGAAAPIMPPTPARGFVRRPAQTSLLAGQHSSASAEWWSPPEIVEPARALWPIDLDPASCAWANLLIGAGRFFTAAEDGLLMPWAADTVWCNPPSAKGESSAWAWWVHGAKEWADGRCQRLLFICFNASSFMTSGQLKARERGMLTPQRAARVEFTRRVRYLRPSDGGVERGDAPPHGSALLLLTDSAEEMRAFAAAYEHMGDALLPAKMPVRGAR